MTSTTDTFPVVFVLSRWNQAFLVVSFYMPVSIFPVYNLLHLGLLLSGLHCYTFALSKQHNQTSEETQ
jgi:hypothetical protein